MNYPRFESEFLESLSFAFRKRRKAISHATNIVDLAKVYELVDGERMERLEIHLLGFRDERLRLHAWPDRQIWLDARRGTKRGWAWEWSSEGRLLGGCAMPDVIVALEASCALFWRMEPALTKEFDAIWVSLIARGPRAV